MASELLWRFRCAELAKRHVASGDTAREAVGLPLARLGEYAASSKASEHGSESVVERRAAADHRPDVEARDEEETWWSAVGSGRQRCVSMGSGTTISLLRFTPLAAKLSRTNVAGTQISA